MSEASQATAYAARPTREGIKDLSSVMPGFNDDKGR